jgi:hypothetical protein
MKINQTILVLAFSILSTAGLAQPWSYNFSAQYTNCSVPGCTDPTSANFNPEAICDDGSCISSISIFSSATASTSFLPTPAAGTARVRVGTATSAAGSFKLVNPGINLGSGTELQMLANAGSTSTTKFSIYDYPAGNTGYLKFKIAFNAGTNGVYTCWVGDGVNFSDNTVMSNAQVFAGLRWSLGSSNTVDYSVSGATGVFVNTGLINSSILFSQGTANSYTVEMCMNNSQNAASYSGNGVNYTLAPGTWDLWVDGTLVGDDLPKSGLNAVSTFDSFAFSHQTSATSPGTIFLDDFEYSNSLVNLITPPTTLPVLLSKDISNFCINGGETVQITGTNFLPGSIVRFNGLEASNIEVLSSSTIRCITPVGITPGSITIETTEGISLSSLASNYQTNPYCNNPTDNIPTFMIVQDVFTTANNAANQTIQIQFDLTWGFSWRDSINYDAAWVFAKYKGLDGLWRHAKLNESGLQMGQGSGKSIDVSSDKLGAFVYINSIGSGTFNGDNIQLQWNYGLDGLTNVTGLEVRVFAVEMVYVPEGEFNVAKRFNGGNVLSAQGDNFPVINTRLTPSLTYNDGTTATVRVKGDSGLDSDNDGIVDKPDYPTGYRPFYCYKYELTEQQYADFLNCLTPIQISTLGIAGSSVTLTNGAYFSSTPNRACENMTAQRALAYADWSGMRPMTILEMNKASYGPYQPIESEFICTSAGCGPSYGVGNTSAAVTNGPVDVGSLDSSSSTRGSSGSSFYGIDDLTGNAVEWVVRLNFFPFNSNNGNGILTANGTSDAWPDAILYYFDQRNSTYPQGARYVRSAE